MIDNFDDSPKRVVERRLMELTFCFSRGGIRAGLLMVALQMQQYVKQGLWSGSYSRDLTPLFGYLFFLARTR